MEQKYIDVGIPTAGVPQLEKEGELTVLKNQLIGLDFHWRRTIETKLPGEIIPGVDPVYRVIDRLPVETYLECVVGSEMNPAAPIEFLKAHAVISRSWAMGKISGQHIADEDGKIDSAELLINWEDTCDHKGFHVCADDHCQRFQGVQPMSDSLRDAIRSTEGLCLYTPDGRLVDARFSKCCGGRTEVFSSCWQPREEPCLESFDDPWCDLSGLPAERRDSLLKTILKDYDRSNGGGYSWKTSISAEDTAHNLRNKFGREIGGIREIQVVERGLSGRAVRLLLKGERGELCLGKELMIRRLLAPTHLYSSWIDIDSTPDREGMFHINGRGWGHGVGLCQIGAARMAMEGHTFEEILAFYYPGSVIRP